MYSLLKSEGSVYRALFACALISTQACAGNTATVSNIASSTASITAAVKIPQTVTVAAGSFEFGSTAAEREYAYQLDEKAYSHSVTRNSGWYANEPEPQSLQLDEFSITKTPITNQQYQQFVNATGHRSPGVDEGTWNDYRLVHPYTRTLRHQWQGTQYPAGRATHPVVMVSYDDAVAYAQWLSKETDSQWRLPTEHEWVKAARGTDGRIFPWGDEFDAAKLNSHDSGPFDTVPVGSRSTPGPFGLTDAAGQVFEWIISTEPARRSWVKGGSWDDKGCGVCRPSARHSRPKTIKHILIGFRLVKE